MRRFSLVAVIAAMFMSADVFACTTAIVGAGASASGKPMIWKQRDASNPENVLVYIAPVEGNYGYTAIFNYNDLKRRSAYAGTNEKGFAIINNLSSNLASTDYDVSNGSIMRIALEKCASVADFERLLHETEPKTFESNFAVLDASGVAAYFEAADASITRYDVPGDGWLVRSNFSLSGSEDGPSGYARYESAYKIMSRHKGKFTPNDLIDGLGRSFYNDVLGYDASRSAHRYVYDEDFIARPTSVSSICIDGSDLMWVAIGYPPASLAVPVWVSAKDEIPGCLTPNDGFKGASSAGSFATVLKKRMHHLPRDARKKYVDFEVYKPIRKAVHKYDRRIVKLFNATFPNGFDKSQVASFNERVCEIYDEFIKEME